MYTTIGVSPSYWLERQSIECPQDIMFQIPVNSTVTGAICNTIQELEIDANKYNTGNVSFMLCDIRVDISLSYEIQDIYPDYLGTIVTRYANVSNGNTLNLYENEYVLNYFMFNNEQFCLYAVLSESDTINMKLNKLGL